MSDKLLYGKNTTQSIVSLEANDGHLELFIQQSDGSVKSEFIANKFWILTDKPYFKSAIKLVGNLHYQWGMQFTTLDELNKWKSILRKKGADFYTIYDDKEAAMVNKGITYFKGLKHNEVTTLSFDIETNGLGRNLFSRVFLISNTFRKNGVVERKLFAHDDYKNDGEMIEAWADWVFERNPSIILGHNIVGYDLKFLDHVTKLHGYPGIPLGRDGSDMSFANYPSKFRIDGSRDQEYNKVKIYGREVIDTMFLAIKYDISKKYESYGLKAIIKHEGLEVKDRQFYDASTIKDNYSNPEEWKKIKAYAEHDADDALALYDLMAPSMFYWTQKVPKSFQAIIEGATGSQINSMMVRSYLQEGHSIPKASPVRKYEGAISIGNPGIYKNVSKVDVRSLYPSIMIAYEVYDVDKDPRGNFLNIVKELTAFRIKNKQLAKETGLKYYSDLEQSEKIGINSAYGFLGAEGLNFNCVDAADFITAKGREILTLAMNWAQDKSFKIVNADTDSIAFCKSDMSFISKEERESLKEELNGLYPEEITFEDDGYYTVFIVLRAKNYVLQTEDGKIKHKGSALKSATLEPKIKEFLSDCLKVVLTDADLNKIKKIYEDYVIQACFITDIKPWCSKKSITEKTLESERTNETKLMDAISDTEYQEGDKVYVFFKKDKSLCLAEDFDGDYDHLKMMEKLYKALLRFQPILPVKETLPNYSLKSKSKVLLENLLAV